MADTSGTFISVEVDDAVVTDKDLAARLEAACPVDIFAEGENGVVIVEGNLDECILCRLCIDAAPAGAVRVVKLYDDGPDAILSSG